MKKLILATIMVAFTGSVLAQNVLVNREELGSGQPETFGNETAIIWDNNIFHAPQYMPGFPTAATLWPRILDVRCDLVADTLHCDGYHWLPEMGRGEYLMIHPVVVAKQPPQIISNTIIKEVPVIVLKEVPVKKKAE